MAQFIDKAAVVVEIENCYNECLKRAEIVDSDYWNAKADAYRSVLTILTMPLEVKEVDLEKEIKNGIYNLSNLYCYMEDLFNGNEEEGVYPIPENVKNELFEFAKHFFELGLKAKENKL